MNDELALMVVHARNVDFAVAAARVQEVVPVDRWAGEPAIDLAQLVGVEPEGGAVRILLLARAGREPLAALVSGDVTLRHIARDHLLPLPAPLAAHVRWISHVVVSDGQQPLLVLDAERVVA
ncbi:MAG TPA: hypothetical protein VN947_35065 [Polyangia bacterium]|nr:hypothetical protein [Polyangia bacterium]